MPGLSYCVFCIFCNIYLVTTLTTQEINLFAVSGNYDATVSVDSSTYSAQNRIVITASGMPDHNWTKVNPHTPKVVNHEINIHMTPEHQATEYGCVPMGKIGLTKTGVSLFNPLTHLYKNAVEGSDAETFDECDGHPDESGEYHYHKLPYNCVYNKGVDEFIGVAYDGYPIYGPLASWHNSGNTNLTSSDLDICHGSNASGSYRYYMTFDWPYIMACYKGKVIDKKVDVTYDCNSTTFQSSWGFLCPCMTSSGTDVIQPPRHITIALVCGLIAILILLNR